MVAAHGRLKPLPYAGAAAAGLLVALILAAWDPVQRVEWSLYDWTMRLATRNPVPAPDVIVVAIDEPSFTELGMPWPWPRSVHAALVDQLAKAGAKSIAFDIVFDVASARPEDDQEFADAVRGAGNVVMAQDQAVIQDTRYALTEWSEPYPALAKAAAALGAVRIPYDPDGSLRRTALEVDGRPTIAAAVAARDARARLPADRATLRLFRFDGASRLGIETVSYYQALDAEHLLPRDIFKGRHVLVGRSLAATSIDEQADLFNTPVAIRMPGVEVHATIVDALLRGRWISDPFAGRAALLGLCLLVAIFGAALTYALSPAWSATAVTALTAMLAGAAAAALTFWNLRLPIFTPALALVLPWASTSTYRFAVTSRERRMIKRAFQHYVAPAIVEKMIADPSQLRLGGEEYDLTVLFSDIEGFTTLSEKLAPEQLRSHLSGYFKDMLDGLLAERGTLDKLIGDAIMVYFGCPIVDADHPMQACRGALAMQRRMAGLNARWAAEGLAQVRTRIGINTGRAVAGNMGTDTIFNFTILGDCVNLASRLEGVNKEYGTLVIIGEDTRERIGGAFEVRELDWIRVKGKVKPVAIYELVAEAGGVDDRRRALFARYAEGLALYRAGQWSDAALAFASALENDPSDPPSRVFLERCRELYAHPPASWDGVHVMTHK